MATAERPPGITVADAQRRIAAMGGDVIRLDSGLTALASGIGDQAGTDVDQACSVLAGVVAAEQ